jgi:hypothetical protein
MGLLGDGWDDPRSSAIMALAGGLLQGDFGAGLLGANAAFQEHGDRKLKRGLLEAQIAETQAQAEERKTKTRRAKELDDLVSGIFGSGGVSAPQVSSGAFAPAADGFGPTMPQTMAAMSAPGSRLAGLGIDQLAALKLRGLDLTKLHEYANTPQKYEGGSFYENRVTGRREFIPKIGEGMGPDGQGGFSDAPGYAAGSARIAGAQTAAQEDAKAARDLVKVYNPATQREELVPRSQVLGRQPQQQPQVPQMPSQVPRQPMGRAMTPEPGVRGDFVGDPAQVMEAISQMRDPQERANAMAAFQEQARRTRGFSEGGGFAAGPSAREAADAAGAKVRAEADARAAAERDATFAKGGANSKDTLTYIAEARKLLAQKPTASGFGSIVDAGANFLGTSTKGADVAAQLDTLSGWMVSNVPRMEGPQSNFDVQNYKTMAATVGDRTKPLSQRIKALDTLEGLQKKYAHLNGSAEKTGSSDLPPPTPGLVRGGYRFKGGNPADKNNWEKQ